LVFLFTATAVNAQYQSETKITETMNVTIDGKQELKVKTILEQKRYLDVTSDNSQDINQDLKQTPVMVTETILIDNDDDSAYEKKIVLHYLKKEDAGIGYVPTKDGIIITKASDKKTLVSTEGDYILDTASYDDLVIEVDDL
jgi:hypothetical protein